MLNEQDSEHYIEVVYWEDESEINGSIDSIPRFEIISIKQLCYYIYKLLNTNSNIYLEIYEKNFIFKF